MPAPASKKTQPLTATEKHSVSARQSARRETSGFGIAALIRIFHFHQRLCRQERITATTLAKETEVSTRTVARDVATMRDRLGAPVEWDPVSGTYCYTEPCDFLPLVRLELAETFSLALAAKTVGSIHAPGLGNSLAAALEKLTPLLGGAVSFPLDTLATIIGEPLALAPLELQHLEALGKAAMQRRAVRIAYVKPDARAAESRLVHPLLLAHLDDRWTLVAHDPAKRALRHFLLVRIRSVEVTATFFKPPADFDPAAYLAGCIGRYAGKEHYEVRIALRGAAAAHARDSAWHRSQVISDLPDGRIEIRLQLNNLVDIAGHILRWGPEAEAISPPELREKVRESLQIAFEFYRSPA